MISLIDGDLIAYRCAASCEKQGVVTEDLGVAQGRAANLINNIMLANGSGEMEYHLFLSGSENFRKQINPAYKANRNDQPRPYYLEPLREWLVVTWGGEITHNCEADDALGITQTGYMKQDVSSVICTLDKDLRQVPGNHYSWEIQGTSSLGKVWVRPEEFLHVSPQEGLFNFYWQLVMGDATDNVFGFDGKARAKVPKFLEDHYNTMKETTSEQELFNYVLDLYGDDSERMLMNGACLYIQREEDDNWLNHGQSLIQGAGQKPGIEDSLPLASEQGPDDGLQSTTV